MARFDVTNNNTDAKMYSVIGTTAGGADELILNGMVGEIGKRIEDNIYELLPLTATATDVFFVATPEVDPDESSIANNTLYGFTNKIGEVQDVVLIPRHRKFAIAENGIVGTIVGGKGYLYAKVGERKLQYSATLPADSKLLAIIEEVVPATQGMVIGANGSNLILKYNMVRARVL